MAKFGFLFCALIFVIGTSASGPGLQVPEPQSFFEEIVTPKYSTYHGEIGPRYILPHDYRLPKGLVPEHYVVHLRPILSETDAGEIDTAPGSVTMFVVCTETMSQITFHSYNISIDTASIQVRFFRVLSHHIDNLPVLKVLH